MHLVKPPKFKVPYGIYKNGELAMALDCIFKRCNYVK